MMAVGIGAQMRAAYRHMLRSAPHAVGFSNAATKNLRRMLADDVRSELAKSSSAGAFIQRARSTLLLYLAAARGRNAAHRTRETTHAHRLVANLASLCYHHLSPNTAMQPNERSRRIGGTDAPSSRRLRSRRAESKSTSLSSTTINADIVLPSLKVRGKRPRGPMPGGGEARTFHPQRWNGQNASRFLDRLEEAELEADLQGKVQAGDPNFKSMLGRLRALRRARLSDEETRQLRQQAQAILADVVQRTGTAGGTSAFLGAARFEKLAKGQWLAP